MEGWVAVQKKCRVVQKVEYIYIYSDLYSYLDPARRFHPCLSSELRKKDTRPGRVATFQGPAPAATRPGSVCLPDGFWGVGGVSRAVVDWLYRVVRGVSFWWLMGD